MHRPAHHHAALLGARNALLLAAVGLTLQGCGAFEPSITVHSLGISPESRTLTRLDATQQFTAEARDVAGSVLSSITVDWSSTDTNVATVDSTGLATSRGPGTTLIVAKAQGVADTATLVVDTSASTLRSVVIPAQNDWTDHGPVLSPNLGGWDAVLEYPTAVLKRSGTLYVYYVAGDGSRSDGGTANRMLGVATADPGSPGALTKHPSNPLVAHAVGISGCEECGVFSAGSVHRGRRRRATLLRRYGGDEPGERGWRRRSHSGARWCELRRADGRTEGFGRGHVRR